MPSISGDASDPQRCGGVCPYGRVSMPSISGDASDRIEPLGHMVILSFNALNIGRCI